VVSGHSQEIEETTTTTAAGGDVYRVRKLGKFIDWAVIVVANQASVCGLGGQQLARLCDDAVLGCWCGDSISAIIIMIITTATTTIEQSIISICRNTTTTTTTHQDPITTAGRH
jgi:hypothetical protein